MSTSNSALLNKTTSYLSTAMPTTEPSFILAMSVGALAIASWTTVFMKTSTIIDKQPSWQSIRGQVSKVVGSIMMGMFILLVTSIIYFLQDQTKSIYVIFILVAFSSVLSYSALAASTIS
jgi:hypothetical protein